MSQFKGVDRLSEYQQLVNTVTDPWQWIHIEWKDTNQALPDDLLL